MSGPTRHTRLMPQAVPSVEGWIEKSISSARSLQNHRQSQGAGCIVLCCNLEPMHSTQLSIAITEHLVLFRLVHSSRVEDAKTQVCLIVLFLISLGKSPVAGGLGTKSRQYLTLFADLLLTLEPPLSSPTPDRSQHRRQSVVVRSCSAPVSTIDRAVKNVYAKGA